MPRLRAPAQATPRPAGRGLAGLGRAHAAVERAIIALGRGFLAHPDNAALQDRLRAGALDARGYFRQLQRLVYRQLFLLEAEARGLPVDAVAFGDADRSGSTGGIADLAGCSIAEADRLAAGRALGLATGGEGLGLGGLDGLHEWLMGRAAEVDVAAGRFRLTAAPRRERKAAGRYYSPPGLVSRLLDAALGPALDEAARGDDPEAALLGLTVCDPACGGGRILVAAAHRIAGRLARVRSGGEEPSPEQERRALRDVVGRCLHGVDLDPLAVELCRSSLRLEAAGPGRPPSGLDERIRCGDSLLGASGSLCSGSGDETDPGSRSLDDEPGGFRWDRAFPGIFGPAGTGPGDGPGGFDVVLGNPPWVSYIGRQRAEVGRGDLRRLVGRFPSVARWPAAHSAFLVLATRLLRDGGRAGLVLPGQVAALAAYGPTRAAATTAARLAGPVEDAGEDAFPGVNQPVGLYVLVADRGAGAGSADPWPIAGGRPAGRAAAWSSSALGIDPSGLLGRLADRPRFGPGTFADPGVHSGNVAGKILSECPPADGERAAPVREGRDVAAFACGAPRRWLRPDPGLLPGEYCTIRGLERYRAVPILVRQTADRPVAARHVGRTYFRNSLLACSGVAGVADAVVVGFLNSALYAALHRAAARDAGQRSFPQVKVGHLHALPAIPAEALARSVGGRPLGVAIEAAVLEAEAGAVARPGAAPPAVLERIERLVLSAFDLPPELAPRLLEAVGR